MASWMVHLRVADALLDKFNGLTETAFVVGNIAPDSGVPTPDGRAYVPDKNTSHFKRPDKTGKTEISPEAFADQYFTKEMRAGYNRKQYSFYLGYYVHLLTDVLWKQEVWYPAVNAYRAAYEADPQEMIRKWKRDWYDLDFRYLREHPDFRAFQIYEQAIGFENGYLDIFAGDAFDDRRKYITGFYRKGREDLDREYPYLNEKQMDKFVEDAVEYIENVLGAAKF
ncbi:MAG: zinc dependent phospholipase C family protein [Lachnospiraceae bacterium]|nr:zinc dependent phospholipase C family protein [Lachnospiraceae bacterium]